MPDQIPFLDIEFVDNPEPRCPCVLLLDTSTSMQGASITLLNEAVELFSRDLLSDRLGTKRVEVAVVTFGEGVRTVQDFTSPLTFVPPRLEPGGSTPMGEGVIHAVGLLEARKRKYQEAGIAYFRPWLFLITDGEPTDYETHYWRDAVRLAREGETAKKLLFFGIAVTDADQRKLNELCPPNRPSLKMRGLSFREFFLWLSSTLRSVSSGAPGATGVALPSPSGWASVDI